ncbi:serine hydrolase domain-containing protein [Pseudofulvibacter geojedonensis]|uniref:Serine hydrolase domain-containing protein n=1 Tax=Pseudofulvibacter geojedonensis TaxID=1123758 RepID=A0ABW3I0V3_9FLAO
MKTYINYIVIAIVVILSSFMLSNKLNSNQTSSVEISTPNTIAPPIEENKTIKTEYYPLNKTQVVKHKLDSLLKRINKRHNFHGSILVAKDHKIIYNNHVGYKDFKTRATINNSSVFQLASVSKQFTAAAIMMLYEKKLIKLTDSVNKYFPSFPYKNVSIKNLLNHTAGLPKYFWIAEHKWNKEYPPSNSEMMDLLSSSNVQRFYKPGIKFDYSNTGYFVLASIVEKVSKTDFRSFVKKNIFDKLGMKNSFVYSYQNDTIRKNQLNGYRLFRGWKHIKIGNTINDAIVGDKNVYATSEDLYKWIVGLNKGKLISKESLNLMYSEGETKYGRKIPYGFGFRINRKQNTIYHNGNWNGFRTGLIQYPKDDLTIIILEHTGYKEINYLSKKVRKITLENFS